ncbi:hypothetical protein Pcinc_018858 [Petrolisthes cinctipes]|uniref:Retrovirus-related Pol polyprotein from transposon TNT 1-94-like beta-barrel domain-containing protein n=1 Tax=Petrolisthes cinctipes TaxID=88211 RepID=A0AAE1FMP9_PETCI|nr:hypothetical protein Pcinc_018858 [Petrolisthes cinctipes]
MTDLGATGYGPRSRLLFNGDEEKYELWEVKFMGHLRLQKLHEVLTATTPDPENNARVYAELVQLLDDTSLSLVIREAKDDVKKAIKILREYYMGTSKPRIISLYTELTSLKMEGNESVTDYLIKAEKAATSLKSANEVACTKPSLGINDDCGKLLVDCGATSHIIIDKSKFVKFDENFEAMNHTIELADGSRSSGVVLGKGVASVKICDTNGNVHNVELRNALYIPTYKQDIFSVKAATKRGASVIFTRKNAELLAPDGTKFDIETH